HIGFNGDFGDIRQLEGKEVEVRCRYEQDLKGNDRERWELVRERETAAEGEAADLTKRFAKLFGAKPAAKPAESSPAPAPATPRQARGKKTAAATVSETPVNGTSAPAVEDPPF